MQRSVCKDCCTTLPLNAMQLTLTCAMSVAECWSVCRYSLCQFCTAVIWESLVVMTFLSAQCTVFTQLWCNIALSNFALLCLLHLVTRIDEPFKVNLALCFVNYQLFPAPHVYVNMLTCICSVHFVIYSNPCECTQMYNVQIIKGVGCEVAQFIWGWRVHPQCGGSDMGDNGD